MSVAFRLLAVVSLYRVRLTFSNTLAAGAFSTGFYAIESEDSQGIDPPVTEALVVPNYPASVELTLLYPLVAGALYRLVLQAGVPATDLSSAASAVQPFPVPAPRATVAGRVAAVDISVFQRDLVHNGQDFVEGPNGDLTTVTGPENARLAARRRVTSNGLPWNRAYGAHVRRFVDAPTGAREELRHSLVTAAVDDDRVQSASVAQIEDPQTGDFSPDVTVKLLDDIPNQLPRRV